MTQSPVQSRREVLRIVALTSGAGALAGCTTPESGEENDEGDPDPEDDDTEDANEEPDDDSGETPDKEEETDEDEPDDDTDPDEEETDEEDEPAEDEAETEDETENEDEDADDSSADDDANEWGDVDEIVLNGITAGWEGVEPAPIEGEENPTLVLTEGEEYDVTWENADGQPHNIEIRDDDEEIVDGYETEIIEEEGETQTLTIEATSEMTDYVCVVHVGTMRGAIEVEPTDSE